MRLLILGGTVFLGRHIVEAALARGHTVTIFTRGIHGPDLYPEVERLRGDRGEDLSALQGRDWDAVIDTSGYVPRIVRRSAEALRGHVNRYVFISTLSVYSDLTSDRIDESGALGTLEDETVEEITGETYGPLKVLCERAVEAVYPDSALIIRPGLIVGPHDPTDRFTYWPYRVAYGGRVLAPGRPDRAVQFVDARDLAEFTVRATEDGLTGVYNVDSVPGHITIGDVLETSKQVSGSDAAFTWFDDQRLLDAGVEPWMELPLWIPESPEMRGFFAFDPGRAVQHGLTYRPLEQTVADTLAWARTRPDDHEWQAGMKPERERELLAEPPP